MYVWLFFWTILFQGPVLSILCQYYTVLISLALYLVLDSLSFLTLFFFSIILALCISLYILKSAC